MRESLTGVNGRPRTPITPVRESLTQLTFSSPGLTGFGGGKLHNAILGHLSEGFPHWGLRPVRESLTQLRPMRESLTGRIRPPWLSPVRLSLTGAGAL